MLAQRVLPYTVEAYCTFYGDEFISSFTHGDLAKGQVDADYAQEAVNQLNSGARRVMPAISFNAKMLKPQLNDGACSAIAFRVCKEALTLLRSLRANHPLTRASRERCFAFRFSLFVQSLERIATGRGAAEKVEQKAIRSDQMALNTITVDREVITAGNAVAEKVTAMATLYGLKVGTSYPEIRVKGNGQLGEQLLDQLNSLPDGVYFFRIIQEKYNHKLEEKGHSAIYIKADRAHYYFDPALGCYSLFAELEKTHLIYNALLSANERFGVDVLSIHRLEGGIHSESLDLPNISGVIDSLEPARPLLIFSPGLGVSIEAYKAMAEGLVRKGFTLLRLEHPETGVGVPRLEEDAIIERALSNGKRIGQVVEHLRRGEVGEISPQVAIGVLGHSVGGSASVEACRQTPEIRAVVNLDGRIIHPDGVSQPVLQVVATRVKEDRTQYNASLEKLANPSLVQVKARHGDFSSPDPLFLSKMIATSSQFFEKHLAQGGKL